MGINLIVKDTKFYPQFKNGIDYTDSPLDFTLNLAGSVMENIKIVQTIDVSWDSGASTSDTFTVSNGSTEISRTSGSFKVDGFASGDEIYVSGAGPYIAGTITDKLIIVTTATSTADGDYTSLTIKGTTDLTALVYNFGLINNDGNYNITSKVSNTDQGYYAASIGADSGGGRSTAFVNMQKLGSYKDFQTGEMKIKYVSNPDLATQRFEIHHEFTIVPYYLDGQLSDLQNNIMPDLLKGLNSLKYVYTPNFRTVLSNPNTNKSAEFKSNLGSTAWFGENFNGFDNNYQVNSIVYQDASSFEFSEGLLIGTKTKVTVIVQDNSANFSASERAGAYVSYLPTQEEYQNTTLTTLKENFLYDVALSNGGAAAVNGNSDPTTPIITNFSITDVVTNTMTLTFFVEYSNLQKAFLSQKNSQDDIYFLIGIQLGDATLTNGNSDRVMILADVKTFEESADIPGLVFKPVINFFPYNEDPLVDSGYTDISLWNEDGFTMSGLFALDLNKKSVLNILEFRLIAENSTTGAFFELDKYVFNIANAVVSGGVQQLTMTDSRGYNLEAGSQFNTVSITNSAPSVGGQEYTFVFSQKISWQDWIKNNFVDTVFYNNAKPNDNLNNKASNYSALNGYDIRMSMFMNASGVSELGVSGITDYHFISPAIKVYDYDLDQNAIPEWTGTIETINPGTSAVLGGAILTGQNTTFKTTWVNKNGAVASLANITAIHRIEETDQNGTDIDELGTLYSYPNNSRVIPKGGFTNLDMYISGGNVITECLISGSQLNSGMGYNISAKLEFENTIDPNAKLTSPSREVKDTSGTVVTKIIST